MINNNNNINTKSGSKKKILFLKKKNITSFYILMNIKSGKEVYYSYNY